MAACWSVGADGAGAGSGSGAESGSTYPVLAWTVSEGISFGVSSTGSRVSAVCESIAQILHIVPDGFVVDLILVACERICDISCRRKVGDIVHEEIDNTVHQDRVADFIFLPDSPDDQCIEYVRDIIVLGLRGLIKIRPGHAALSQIPRESCIPVREGIILAELTEREREHLHFKGSTREKRSKV